MEGTFARASSMVEERRLTLVSIGDVHYAHHAPMDRPVSIVQERPWIQRASYGIIHSVVEVKRRTCGISGVAHVAENISLPDHIARIERAILVEMRVVVHLPAGTHNRDYPATECVRTDAQHDAIGRAAHRRPALRKNVDTLVPASVTSRCTP